MDLFVQMFDGLHRIIVDSDCIVFNQGLYLLYRQCTASICRNSVLVCVSVYSSHTFSGILASSNFHLWPILKKLQVWLRGNRSAESPESEREREK